MKSNLMKSPASKTGGWSVTTGWLVAVYLLVLVAMSIYYFQSVVSTRKLKAELSELVIEKNNLEELSVEAHESSIEIGKRWRQHESAFWSTIRAIQMTQFEDLNLADSPFFVASHRPSLNGQGMEVIVNVPAGGQRLRVSFPTQSDLEQSPAKLKEKFWMSDALHFGTSQEVILNSGEMYQITYGFIEEGDTKFVAAKVRTKEKTIFTQKFQWKSKRVGVSIYGSGTRNTVFLPGKIAEPFHLLMADEGKRPTNWSWAMFENMKDGQKHTHHLRFIYEGEPPVFISPVAIAEVENIRRNYQWVPLALSEMIEDISREEKFVLKTLPTSSGRKSIPLY